MSRLERIHFQSAGFDSIALGRGRRMVVRRSWFERFEALGLLDPEALRERVGSGNTGGRFLRRIDLSGTDDGSVCFVKVHCGGGLRRALRDRIRGIWRPSRAFCELEHLIRFERLGIPTAPGVAAAEIRCGGIESCSLLVTASIESSIPLADTLEAGGGDRSKGGSFRRKGDLLARLARRIGAFHRAGIVWPDLMAKHCFVDSQTEEILFLDLERLRERDGTVRDHPARDLAALGLTGSESQVTRGDRLRFLRAYAQETGSGDPRVWLVRAHEAALGLAVRRSRYRWYLQRSPRSFLQGTPDSGHGEG